MYGEKTKCHSNPYIQDTTVPCLMNEAGQMECGNSIMYANRAGSSHGQLRIVHSKFSDNFIYNYVAELQRIPKFRTSKKAHKNDMVEKG